MFLTFYIIGNSVKTHLLAVESVEKTPDFVFSVLDSRSERHRFLGPSLVGALLFLVNISLNQDRSE